MNWLRRATQQLYLFVSCVCGVATSNVAAGRADVTPRYARATHNHRHCPTATHTPRHPPVCLISMPGGMPTRFAHRGRMCPRYRCARSRHRRFDSPAPPAVVRAHYKRTAPCRALEGLRYGPLRTCLRNWGVTARAQAGEEEFDVCGRSGGRTRGGRGREREEQ